MVGRIQSMLQGMTQQDSLLRQPNQGDLLLNGVPHEVFGLGKRPCTEHIGMFGSRSVSNVFAHAIVREGEGYVFYYDGTEAVVLDFYGRRYPLSLSEGALTYLNTLNPRSDIRGLTLADTTILLNRSKTTAMDSTLKTPALTNVALVWVKRGSYDQDYRIKANGTQIATDNPGTSVTEAATSKIALDLATTIDALTDYIAVHVTNDSVFTFSRADGTAFTVEAQDTAAGSLLGAAFHQIDRFAELPTKAPQGYRCKVYGSLEEETDDYWIEFDAEGDARTNRPRVPRRGNWIETTAPEIPYRIDSSTMPHRLDRRQDDETGSVTGTPYGIYFRLEPIEWEDRVVGDEESSPDPSFIGHGIESMFLYRNRLGFLSRGNVVLSRSGDFFNFFRSATIQVVDDDPIDVGVPSGKALDLFHGVPFDEELLLIGKRAQVVLSSEGTLTPSSVRTKPATELEVDTTAVPAPVEGSVFLPTWGGVYSGMLEYYVAGDNARKTYAPVSSAVPELMRGQVTRLVASSLERLLVAQASATSNYLYVYKWLDADRQRVQSAWGIWTMSSPVLWFDFVGSDLWVILARPEGPTLERVRLDLNRIPDGASAAVLLDRLLSAGPPGGVVQRVAEADEESEGESLVGGDYEDGRTLGGGGGLSPYFPIEDGVYGSVPEVEDTSSLVMTEIGTIPGTGGSTPPTSPPIPPLPDPDPIPGVPGGSGTGVTTVPPINDQVVVTYSPAEDKTCITLPYTPSTRTVVVEGATGAVLRYTANGNTLCIANKNLSGQRLFIGEVYVFRYRFAPACVYAQTQTGAMATVPGRLSLTKWAVNFSSSGPFTFEVFRDGVLASTRLVVQRRLREPLNNRPRTGSATVRVLREAQKARVDLVNRYHTQAWFISAHWEGEFSPLSRTV